MPSGLRFIVTDRTLVNSNRCPRRTSSSTGVLRLFPELLQLVDLLLFEFGFLARVGGQRDEGLHELGLLLRLARVATALRADCCARTTGVERQHEWCRDLQRFLAVDFFLAEERRSSLGEELRRFG